MVIRAFKHIIRAVIAAIGDIQNMSSAIAETLNILLGLEMATGTNSSGLDFSDLYPPKKNPSMAYSFSVTGRDFIPNPNPSG
jgi:hypothetical protein